MVLRTTILREGHCRDRVRKIAASVRRSLSGKKKTKSGAPGRYRTCNPCLRRAVLYPLSYGRSGVPVYQRRPARPRLPRRPGCRPYNFGFDANRFLAGGACRLLRVARQPEDSMTAAHETNEIDGPHEGPIKTPKQLILAVLYAFVVPIFGIILLVMFVTTETRPAAGSDAHAPEGGRRADPPGRHGRGEGRSRPRLAEDRRAGLRRAVHRLPRRGRARRAQARRCGRLGVRASRPASTRCSTRRSPARARCRRRAAATSATSRSRARSSTWPTRAAPSSPSRRRLPRGAVTHRQPRPPRPSARRAGDRRSRRCRRAGQGSASPHAAPPRRRRRRRRRDARRSTPRPAPSATPHGIAGAPKIGDKAAWAPRIAQGVDGLTASVDQGQGRDAAQGGIERERRRDQGRRHLHGRAGEVAALPRHESAGLAPAFSFARLRAASGGRARGDSRSAPAASSKATVSGAQTPRSTASAATSMSSVWTMPRPSVAGEEEPPVLVDQGRRGTAPRRPVWLAIDDARRRRRAASRQTHGAASSST